MADIIPRGMLERIVVAPQETVIDLEGIAPGVHAEGDFIFSLKGDGQVEWVVSSICDHAHGRLQLCENGGAARCPLHGWELDTKSLAYRNVAFKKPRLPFRQESGAISISTDAFALSLPEGLRSDRKVKAEVRFISHACMAIDVGGVRIVTDPWLFGPCFIAGWWHAFPPKEDALEIVNSADVIYVSHNHPDHMHIETLAHVRKDIRIVVPDFPSQSTVKPIREMGFPNVEALPFNSVFQVGTSDVFFSILQAGDFRDDSGLYVSAGDFSCLLAVDSNALNNFVLPQNVSLLMTAFAGGASGFPVCFDVVPEGKKDQIVARNKGAAAAQAMEYIARVKPLCYVPYAGFFTEAAERDLAVKQRNKKNSSAEAAALAARTYPDLIAHDPLDGDLMVFEGGEVRFSNVDRPRLYTADGDYTRAYVEKLKAALADYSVPVIEDYFARANFRDDLVLYLVPTDDAFDVGADEAAFVIDFSGLAPKVETVTANALFERYSQATVGGKRHLLVKVRKDAFWPVIRDHLPWEDLSIGFQCRIDRKPDVYNSDFWFHFTNVHIGALDEREIA